MKIFSALSVITLMLLAISACGGSNGAPAGTEDHFAAESKARKKMIVNKAFSEKPALMAPPATVKKIQNLFDTANKVGQQNSASAAKYFDYREMANAVFRVIGSFPDTEHEMTLAEGGMRTNTLSITLEKDNSIFNWEVAELRRVELSEDKKVALVYARHWHDEYGSVSSIRWWLYLRDGKWRFYDWEDLEWGDRASNGSVGVVCAHTDVRPPDWTKRVETYNKAIDFVNVGEYKSALNVWKSITNVMFPPDMRTIVHISAASCCYYLDELDEALKWLAKAEKIKPDVPVISTYRAWIYQQKQEWANAIKHYRRFITLLAEEPAINNAIASCLLSLDKPKEALAEYQKTFDIWPNISSFLGIVETIKSEDSEELVVCQKS